MRTYLTTLIILCAITFSHSQTVGHTSDPDFASFQLEDIQEQLDAKGGAWQLIMGGENVLTGLYTLKVGAKDGQRPHDTDEVYYVVSGKARFTAGDEDVAIQSGSILFVKAEVAHRFYDIEEDIVMVVFFDVK